MMIIDRKHYIYKKMIVELKLKRKNSLRQSSKQSKQRIQKNLEYTTFIKNLNDGYHILLTLRLCYIKKIIIKLKLRRKIPLRHWSK